MEWWAAAGPSGERQQGVKVNHTVVADDDNVFAGDDLVRADGRRKVEVDTARARAFQCTYITHDMNSICCGLLMI